MLNGEELHATLLRGGTAVDVLFDFDPDVGRGLEELWLMTLSRRPTDAELARFAPSARAHGRDGLRRIAFALFCCREFGALR